MSKFNATKGQFWIAQLPDGQFAVLWTHPNLGQWHRQIAAFPSKERAESYVINESQALSEAFASPDLAEPVPDGTEEEFCTLVVSKNPRMHALITGAMRSMGAKEENGFLRLEKDETKARKFAPNPVTPRPLINRDQMLADLPDLFALHPEGVTAVHFMERYGSTYNDTLQAMRWLDARGVGKWVFRGGRQGAGKILLPSDVPHVEMDLSVKQEKVLGALASKKAKDGTVAISMAEIEALTGVSKNGMGAHLWSLERKNYIELIQKAPHGGVRPAIYKVLKIRPRTNELPAPQGE